MVISQLWDENHILVSYFCNSFSLVSNLWDLHLWHSSLWDVGFRWDA